MTESNSEDWPEIITAESKLYKLALQFGKKPWGGRVPLYLANLTGQDLGDVVISSYGLVSFDKETHKTTEAVKKIDLVENGTGKLVEIFNEFDADSVTFYEIKASFPDGSRHYGKASTVGIPDKGWIKIDGWGPAEADADRND